MWNVRQENREKNMQFKNMFCNLIYISEYIGEQQEVAAVKALHLKAELCGLIRCSAIQFSLMDSHTVIKTGIRRDKL